MSAWTEHVARWKDCDRCPLAQQRDRIVLARGKLPCDVLLIGEAPGVSEDMKGIPFHGPAGGLLDEIVKQAVIPEVKTAFCNLVCCFPREAKARGDNEPSHREILACRPRLVEFVNLAQPRLIVCVGSLATQYVDHKSTIPCVDIVHPAYILVRMPAAQKGMAVQHSVVIVRNAVKDMLKSTKPFERWGDAETTIGHGLGQRWTAWTETNADVDVPF